MADIQFGALTSTTTTVKQTVVTYTPGASLMLKCILISGCYTTWSATEANLGTVYLQVGGVDKAEFRIQNTDLDTLAGIVVIPLGDGLQFSGAESVSVHVTPASTTSMRWTASLFFQ
jgi:hypothetical protein